MVNPWHRFQDVGWNILVSDWKKITPADLELLPVGYRKAEPTEWLDGNNHTNVMWF
jgi:hypothetical protein